MCESQVRDDETTVKGANMQQKHVLCMLREQEKK